MKCENLRCIRGVVDNMNAYLLFLMKSGSGEVTPRNASVVSNTMLTLLPWFARYAAMLQQSTSALRRSNSERVSILLRRLAATNDECGSGVRVGQWPDSFQNIIHAIAKLYRMAHDAAESMFLCGLLAE